MGEGSKSAGLCSVMEESRVYDVEFEKAQN